MASSSPGPRAAGDPSSSSSHGVPDSDSSEENEPISLNLDSSVLGDDPLEHRPRTP